jgi:hypothetical protein
LISLFAGDKPSAYGDGQLVRRVVPHLNTQTGHAIAERGDLVIDVGAVAILDYVMRCVSGGQECPATLRGRL